MQTADVSNLTDTALAHGLTEQDVLERRAQGLGNTAAPPSTRSYWQILSENVFTFINMSLFGLGLALVLLGRWADGLVSTGVISLNVLVSVVQEIRAKRVLDRVALLTRPTATVIREGKQRVVAPSELVVGDVLKVSPGDQIVVDGRIIGDERIDVDESLLTGESDPVSKRGGDKVYSGSLCLTGTAHYVAEHVSVNSLAHQITAGAHAFRRILTPLQQEIHLVIRIMLLIVIYLEFLSTVTALVHHANLSDSVADSTLLAGLVPNGLLLSIAVAYALGAVRILRYGALVQQANAIESLSHVDVLCLDKTGTLTTNRLRVSGYHPLGASDGELEDVLGTLAASTASPNQTTAAIAAMWPRPRRSPSAEIPFSSARKWSAEAFDDAEGNGQHALRGVYVLGAPEMLLPHLSREGAEMWPRIAAEMDTLTEQGLRVVLLAHAPATEPLDDQGDDSRLPDELRPLGLVSFRDELRPEAQEALAAFIRAGVQPKIISGDNPDTVASLARQAGLGPDIEVISGLDLEQMSEDEFAAAAESGVIFGRTTPRQKEKLVRALRQHGHYVAVIGDGVNDVLPLKQAQLAIAMQSGSQATRSVADLILMQDSFAVLAPAVREGQRILSGMQSILKLFLARISSVGLVVLSSMVIGTFPLEVRQGSMVTLFSVGIPTVALAVWTHPRVEPQGSIVRRLIAFIFPAAILTSAIGVTLFVSVYLIHALETPGAFLSRTPLLLPSAEPVAQTSLTYFIVSCGLFLVIFVEPPTRWWVGGSQLSGDWRPTWLAIGLMAAMLICSLTPPLRTIFALSPLGLREYALLAVALILWLFTLRFTWRLHLLDRFLAVGDGVVPGRAE